MVVEDYRDDRQAEERRAADVGLLLDRVHGNLNGYRHELLYLLGRTSAPLGNDCDLRIGDIRKRIYGRILETQHTYHHRRQCEADDEIFALE